MIMEPMEHSTCILLGIGIKNMEKRVEDLKGIIHIGTENGFRIFISIPKGEKD